MKIKLLIAFIATMVLSGCDNTHNVSYHRPHSTKQTVKVYKEHNPQYVSTSSSNDAWIYWYVFDNDSTYYSYSSTSLSKPSSYSSFNWQSSLTSPISKLSANNIEEIEEEIVPNEELGQQVETSIETTEAQVDTMVNEGNPNNSESESSTSEGSSSEGSSGDSGGGGD